MKKLIIKATALTFISVTTVFAATANDKGFDQRMEFPELIKMQQEFAEQNAHHQPILNSTMEFFEAIEALNTITDDAELAKQLAYLEKRLAMHLTALGEARSDVDVLLDKAKQEFADYGTVEDVELIEQEIVKTLKVESNYEKNGIIRRGHIDDAAFTKTMFYDSQKIGVEKPEPVHRKTGIGTAIASVYNFLVTLDLSYRLISHHIGATELLFVTVQRLSTVLNTAIADDCEKIITTREFGIPNCHSQTLKHSYILPPIIH